MFRLGLCICLAGIALAATAADKPRLVVDAGGHTATIRSLVFTRDGKYLVSAGLDKAIRIWDLATGQTVRTIRGWIGVWKEGNIYDLALSPDDRYLAVSGYMGRPTKHSGGHGGPAEDTYENVNAVRIFDFQTGELLDTLHGNDDTVNQLTFTTDKNYLLAGSADGKICVWLITPEQMKRVHTFGGHKRGIKQIAVRNGDTTVASLSFDGNMKIWDAVTGLLIRGMGRQKHLAASPDGQYLISVTEDDRVLIWNFKDGGFVRELTKYDGDIQSISYIANGTKLLVDTDRGPKVLAADSGEVITTLKRNAEQSTTTAISRDGYLVASGLQETDDISIWNSENGEVRRLGGVGMPFYAVGFSNDGHAIAFGRESIWKGVNNRGPLQGAFRFAQGDSYQIGFENRINKSDFSRSRDASGELALRLKESPYDALEILKNDRLSGEIKTGNPFTCYTLTADGHYIIGGTYDGHIEVYKTESPKLAFLFGRKDQDLVGHEGPVWAVAASPDNRTVVSG
jgi:WD40 repeat protein